VRAESPDLVLAKRLLDELKLRGFEFRRAAPGVDGPLVGNRSNGGPVDLIQIDGSVAIVSLGGNGHHR